MNRRGFLKSILAAGVAPYVSTMAGVLMPGKQIVTLEDYTKILPWSGEKFSLSVGGTARIKKVMGHTLVEPIEITSVDIVSIDKALKEFWDQYSLRPTKVYINDEQYKKYFKGLV